MAKKKTPAKKNPASGLVRNSKLRSRLWKLERDKFKTYADTAKAASYLIKKQKAEGVQGKMPNTFIKTGTVSYLTERPGPITAITKRKKKPKEPQLSPSFQEGFHFYDIDERMNELLSSFNNMSTPVRSRYSEREEFPLGQYDYEETFQKYVDAENANRTEDDKYGDEYFITVEYDEVENIYYIWLHKKSDPIDDSTILEDTILPSSQTEAPGYEEGEEEESEPEEIPEVPIVKPNRGKELDEKYRELEILKDALNVLKEQRAASIQNLRTYKELGLKGEFKKESKELSILSDNIYELQRRISTLMNKKI